MSKVEQAMDRMISNLEHIGYTTEEAIDKINNDLDQTKKEIDEYWEWVESRVDGFCNP
tara:strand:+ start:373 stop:546 length:174 start_codon:yes stop_codon:yes gene_type:complete